MTLSQILADHLRDNVSRVPYTAAELRCVAQFIAGKPVSLGEIEAAVADLVARGEAQPEGDGWVYAEREAVAVGPAQRSLF